MLISIVDVETTGLDPSTHEVIEVGAILYSVEHRAVLQQVSTLLPVVTGDDGEICPVSGINLDWCDVVEVNRLHQASLGPLIQMLGASDFAVAFNSDFEEGWFDEHSPHSLPSVRIPWADAAAIRYPRPSNSRSLIALCVAHGIPVVSAHRALDDCRLLAELLGKVPDLEGELVRAARPKVLVKALVGFEGKDAAKAAGFYWDREVPRAWAKRMPWEDAEELPFEVMEIVPSYTPAG